MPPKKQDAARVRDELKVPDEAEATCTTTDQGEVVTGSTTDQLKDMLQTFLRKEQQREDRLEREAQRQEHKWQVLHH